ncbi:MAG UNVERIFIED_CONTAM: hypothetical protein LVT10_10850 [Anaerolineae bacterium]|jgi:sensor histidine kinase regulating citrate/malate metabolism
MNSIRTRFILSYVALVVLVFGAFSIFMAQQISIMARHDFEARLRNYAVLIAESRARRCDGSGDLSSHHRRLSN